MCVTPWLCMTLDVTLQQIKRTMLHILPISHAVSLFLLSAPLFLNHPSPIWWAQLSSTNEQFLYLTVFCISLWLFYFSHHYCTESLYGDVTEKPLLNCCACGTAKYRVTFFGNWSEKSHPKDYPRKHKLQRFLSSDLSSITHSHSAQILFFFC